MTNQQILEKAIKKAKKSGWDMFGAKQIRWESGTPLFTKSDEDIEQERKTSEGLVAPVWTPLSYYDIIFNHSFARALWGKQPTVKPMSGRDEEHVKVLLEAWRIHLMSMVIAEDPIKYLGENI